MSVIELTKDQKIQIIDNRRLIVARNIFELELDVVVMTSQGRLDEVEVLNKRMEELKATDASLEEFMNSL